MGGVIINIRQRFGVVLIFLIALAIVAFLVMDVTSNNNSLFNRNPNTAGSVDGIEIDNRSYSNRVTQELEAYRWSQQTNEVPEQQKAQLNKQAWEQYVNQLLVQSRARRLGIVITSSEMEELFFGSNIHPALRQQPDFQNPETGQFDVNRVIQKYQSLSTLSEAEANWWRYLEDRILEDRYYTKYSSLIKKAVYTPTWMAEEQYQIRNKTVDFNYVQVPYSSVGDGEVEVTDKDIQQYLKDNAAEYEQKETRTVEYVTFDIIPSTADTQRVMDFMVEMKPRFENTESDSVFVNIHSDQRFDPRYYSREEMTGSMVDTFFNMEPDSMIGPYYEDGQIKIAKLLDRRMVPDSAYIRHIFLGARSFQDLQDKLSMADSLKTVLENGEASFDTLAKNLSDDTRTGANGGVIGWVKPGNLPIEIDLGTFYKNEEGDLFVAQSQSGAHIVRIDTAKAVKEGAKVAFLTKTIDASMETVNEAYEEAVQFANEHRTDELFEEAKQNYNVRVDNDVKAGDFSVDGLTSGRDLVVWAFNAEEGDVTTSSADIINVNSKYVVAHLANITPEGLPSVDDVRGEITAILTQEKKAEQLKERIGQPGALQGIAAQFGTTVQTATGRNFTSVTLATSNEPKVVGLALGTGTGNVGGPVAGNAGVYLVKVTAETPAQDTDMNFQKQQMRRSNELAVDQMLLQSLKDQADVKDQRYKAGY